MNFKKSKLNVLKKIFFMFRKILISPIKIVEANANHIISLFIRNFQKSFQCESSVYRPYDFLRSVRSAHAYFTLARFLKI